MSTVHFPPLNRVPGQPAERKEYALDKDLTKLSLRELLDLKNRQLKLLENKSRLQKLPDKGQKIQNLLDRTVQALELKDQIESASNLLSSLKLGPKEVNDLEWNAGTSKNSVPSEILDSDDDEDPLAILASSNSVSKNKKIVRQLEDSECDKKLITDQDLKEAEEIVKGQLKLDPVLQQICDHDNLEPPRRFLLNKPKPHSLGSSSSSLDKEVNKKLRDNSAATPPVTDRRVEPLSLKESLEIEFNRQQRMKELQEKQAAERLAAKIKELGPDFQLQKPDRPVPTQKPEASFMSKYRVPSSLVDDDGETSSLSDGDGYDDD